MRSNQVRLVSAAIGASAVVAMGAVTAAVSDDAAETVVSDADEMTTGETTTQSVAATELETTIAVPEVKAEPPDGFGFTPP